MKACPRLSRARNICLVIVAVASALALCLGGACTSTNQEIPNWVVLHTASLEADFDGDGKQEELHLANGQAEVRDSIGLHCTTPQEWTVADAFSYDFDGDGASEIALVVWKQGSYGTSRPFWVERDTTNMTQHLFVMRYGNDSLEPMWMSSALDDAVQSVWIDDLGFLHLADSGGKELVGQWESWGFTLVGGIAPSALTVEQESAPNGDSTVSFIAVGDNIMHLSLCDQEYDVDTRTYDFGPVYEHVANRVSSYDLAAVCQETPLVHDRSAISDYPDFGTPEEAGNALADAGFNIVASATNHAYDKGEQGIEDTVSFWANNHPDVAILGVHDDSTQANSARFIECNGMRFALFDATYGLNGHALPSGQEWRIDTLDDIAQLAENITHAEGDADLTICFLHIGDEYADAPSPEQRQVTEQLVDAGADLVICTHPHIVQPVERLKTPTGAEAVVFWSLGNFASHQTDPRTILGAAAIVVFERNAEGHAIIASYAAEPTVCHFNEEETAVYFLDSYTGDLARTHYLSTDEHPLTVSGLRDLWPT